MSKKTPKDKAQKPPKSAPEKLARPFATALADMKKALAAPKPAPPPPKPAKAEKTAPPPPPPPSPKPVDPLGHHAYEDRAAFQQAFAGVRPLSRPHGPAPARITDEERSLRSKVAADLAAADEAARARLDALVAGSVGFVVRRNTSSGEVEGLREGERETVLRGITGPKVAPQGSIDLHGLHGPEAERELARFIRARHAKGERTLLVVHGKGRHSEGGVGVLADHVLRCLTEGGAAVYVRAFVTAPERFGGLGAIIVRLTDR